MNSDNVNMNATPDRNSRNETIDVHQETNDELNQDMMIDRKPNESTSIDSKDFNNPISSLNYSLTGRRLQRPTYKLSVCLIETYKTINKVYYDAKAKKSKEQQEAATSSSVINSKQDAISSSNDITSDTGIVRNGVHNNGFDDTDYNYIINANSEGEIFNKRYIFKHKLGNVSDQTEYMIYIRKFRCIY